MHRRNNYKNEYTKNDFYVRFIYNNKQIGDDVSYKEFSKKLNEKIILFEELEDFCRLKEENANNDDINDDILNSESNKKYKIFGTILIYLFPILTSISIFLFFKIRIEEKDNVEFPGVIINENEN